MRDFNTLDRIISLVCRPTPTLSVRHVVELTRPGKSEGAPPMGYIFEFTTKGGKKTNFKPSNQMVLVHNSYIELETKKPKFEQNGKIGSFSIKMQLQNKDIPMFLNMIETAYKWLTDGSVFVRDVDGRPVKVADPLLSLSSPVSFGERAIMKPCIIRDANDLKYDGLVLGSSKENEFTNFTSSEFAFFRMQMTSLSQNLYMASLLVAQQAMMYYTYENMQDAGGANVRTFKPQPGRVNLPQSDSNG